MPELVRIHNYQEEVEDTIKMTGNEAVLRKLLNFDLRPNISLEYGPDDAIDWIKEQLEKGVKPVVTVPVKYKNALKEGLKPRTTWIGSKLIAGTFGRPPYLPESEKRVVCVIKNIDASQIKPRATGPQRKFQGVVILSGPIPPENIEIIGNVQII